MKNEITHTVSDTIFKRVLMATMENGIERGKDDHDAMKLRKEDRKREGNMDINNNDDFYGVVTRPLPVQESLPLFM